MAHDSGFGPIRDRSRKRSRRRRVSTREADGDVRQLSGSQNFSTFLYLHGATRDILDTSRIRGRTVRAPPAYRVAPRESDGWTHKLMRRDLANLLIGGIRHVQIAGRISRDSRRLS